MLVSLPWDLYPDVGTASDDFVCICVCHSRAHMFAVYVYTYVCLPAVWEHIEDKC